MSATNATADTFLPQRAKPISRLRARLAGRPDTEHEMSFNRLVFALMIVLYLAISDGGSAALFAMAAYIVLACAILAHLLLSPQPNALRRAGALLLDLCFLSWQMHMGDNKTAVLFPIYLWVVFGNGFRFGITWLRIATAVAWTGFAAVVISTPFWRGNASLSIGLLVGLVILPLYAGTLIQRLSQARRIAEQASRAKTMFLASVSHELRTPLNAIIGTTCLLESGEASHEQREMARTIDTAARSLLGLIDSILDYSRIESGRIAVQISEFELTDVLDEVRRLIAVQAGQKGLGFFIHVDAATPLRIRAERSRIQQVLLNLTGNALKFTHAGSIVVAVDPIGTPDGRLQLRFRVTDTGIGISPDKHQHIFDSFAQADETIINRYGGTGLGLAICKSLAEAMGGAIGVQSETGQGSTFWFTVRAESAEAGAVPTDAAAADLLLLSQHGDLAESLATSLGTNSLPIAAGPEQLAGLLRAIPPRRPVVVFVDPRGLADHAPALAAAIRDSAPQAPPPLILLDPACRESGNDPAVQRAYASILRPLEDPGAARRALRVALLPFSGALEGEQRASEITERPARRVLVADDNLVNRKVLTKILERAGHQVHAVCDGKEVLNALDAEEYDVVVMDLNMPVMDGIEATKLYRMSTLGLRRAAIIGLTADATQEAQDRCLEAGMDACLTKPIEPARLLDAIEEASAKPEPNLPSIKNVTEIASHPRFRSADTTAPMRQPDAAVDARVLASLTALGGTAFLNDLTCTFLTTADHLLDDLHRSLVANDAERFQAAMHALASAGANLGTTHLVELCRTAQRNRQADLTETGSRQVEQVVSEVQRVRLAFNAHVQAAS